MWKIIEGLYLGDSRAAADREALSAAGVTHVLNCTTGVPCEFPENFEYMQRSVGSYYFADQIDELCEFVDNGRTAGGVMIHCHEGRQRGPAAVIAYLCHSGYSVEEAIDLVRQATLERPGRFEIPPRGLMQPIRDRFEA